MKPIRDNALTIFFLALTLLTLVAQAFAGLSVERAELVGHEGKPVPGMLDYVTSSEFGAHVLENWQSEFMQFFLFIMVTVWLAQRGSAEAKEPGKEGLETPGPGGLRGHLRSNGLALVMLACFVATWFGQSLTGLREFNEEQSLHGDPQLTWSAYVTAADFWEKTLQNWQSEFLAVAAMAIFTVYLRQHGSPESKHIDTPASENEPTY